MIDSYETVENEVFSRVACIRVKKKKILSIEISLPVVLEATGWIT